MITHEKYRRVKAMRADGASVSEISTATGIGRQSVYKIDRGTIPEPAPTPRCGGCHNPLKSGDCLGCQLKRRRGQATFAPVPLPTDVSESERARLETPLAGIVTDKLANCLERAGIRTVNDLLHRKQAELLALHGVGIESMKKILRALEKLGFDTTKSWQALNRHIARAHR